MKKNEIMTEAFLERLVAVYGNDEAAFQQERYAELVESFEKNFSADADLRFFSAPGRTEVGGNHTDHNNGKVLAAAINLDAQFLHAMMVLFVLILKVMHLSQLTLQITRLRTVKKALQMLLSEVCAHASVS